VRYPKRGMISSVVPGAGPDPTAAPQLGLTTAVRFAPMLVFGPVGGLFADRMNKRRVLYVTQAASGLLAGAFAVLTATHDMRLWANYLLAVATFAPPPSCSSRC